MMFAEYVARQLTEAKDSIRQLRADVELATATKDPSTSHVPWPMLPSSDNTICWSASLVFLVIMATDAWAFLMKKQAGPSVTMHRSPGSRSKYAATNRLSLVAMQRCWFPSTW